MAGCLPGDPFNPAIAKSSACNYSQEDQISSGLKWYFTKEEIENHSPSRKDGISFKEEAHLRSLYCAYLSELGIAMKMPQKTIAAAMMFCHRFFMRQSHAKNHWQSIAASGMFLASKAEETPCFLRDMVVVAYKLANKWDPLAPQKMKQKEIFDQQKETLLLGERLMLATLAFELSIELPYKSLVTASKQLKIPNEVIKVAWNYVNDWVRTTLCLQYKPHYIAAGSLFFAARREKIELPSTKGNVWWMHFDVSPKQLDGFIQYMKRFIERYDKKVMPSTASSTAAKSECKSQNASLSSPESCVSNGSVAAQDLDNRTRLESEGASKSSAGHQTKKRVDVQDDSRKAEVCQMGDIGSPNSVVEEGDASLKVGKSDQNLGFKHACSDASYNIDVDRIKEKLKKRRLDRNIKKPVDMGSSLDIDNEAWIERELETGLET